MDLIGPTRGTIRVLDYDLRRDPVAARRTGYLPGDRELYRDMSGRELLTFFASLRPGADLHMRSGSPGAWIWIAMCTTCPGQQAEARRRAGLHHRPDLLVFDEPSSGLDPLVQREFHALVRGSTDACLSWSSPPVPAEPFLTAPGVRTASVHRAFVRCEVIGPVGDLMRLAAAKGLVNVISHEPDLDRIFLSYIEGGAAYAA